MPHEIIRRILKMKKVMMILFSVILVSSLLFARGCWRESDHSETLDRCFHLEQH
jgi:cell division protein FtsL